MRPVTDDDLQGAWLLKSRIPGSVTARTKLIGRANRIISRAYTQAGLTVEDAVESGLSSEEALRDVQIELCMMVLRNPLGARSLNEATGPFTGGMTFGGDVPGLMYLTDAMYEDLGLSSYLTSRRTGSVPTWDKEVGPW